MEGQVSRTIRGTSISFSAPRHTNEDETRERSSLSDEEKAAIAKELYGKDKHVETEVMRTSGPILLEQHMIAMPAEKKAAYLEALARVPYLVAKESPPIAFLRCENFNIQLAAERLARYWAWRKMLFAEDAFLPMTLHGAMRDYHPMVEQGIMEILPDDSSGRAVILIDRSRSDPSIYDRKSLARSFFFLLSAVLERESVQKHGLVVITNVKHYSPSHFDRKMIRMEKKQGDECLPLKVKAIHVVCGPYKKSVFHMFVPVLKQLIGKEWRMRLLIHLGSDKEILAELKKYGMSGDDLPQGLGGVLDIQHHLNWLEARRRVELERDMEHEREQLQHEVRNDVDVNRRDDI